MNFLVKQSNWNWRTDNASKSIEETKVEVTKVAARMKRHIEAKSVAYLKNFIYFTIQPFFSSSNN